MALDYDEIAKVLGGTVRQGPRIIGGFGGFGAGANINAYMQMKAEQAKGQAMTDHSEIRDRLARATPGPWQRCDANNGKCKCCLVWSILADSPVATTSGYGFDGSLDDQMADAELIAHAPADLAALLAENDALRPERVDRAAGSMEDAIRDRAKAGNPIHPEDAMYLLDLLFDARQISYRRSEAMTAYTKTIDALRARVAELEGELKAAKDSVESHSRVTREDTKMLEARLTKADVALGLALARERGLREACSQAISEGSHASGCPAGTAHGERCDCWYGAMGDLLGTIAAPASGEGEKADHSVDPNKMPLTGGVFSEWYQGNNRGHDATLEEAFNAGVEWGSQGHDPARVAKMIEAAGKWAEADDEFNRAVDARDSEWCDVASDKLYDARLATFNAARAIFARPEEKQ